MDEWGKGPFFFLPICYDIWVTGMKVGSVRLFHL